ncbi:hypothetical protein PBAL39_09246 [Pedobacter sp. BAL39]|uniref:metabolite traffic protein EboE n=1 Tax=Pedobacter sp. BAL39 TaxID=391596 RepID=UPI00015599D7|nr:metabolite traffic protein EboE [Pedobacter sp. BAL39]EDM37317.1 hypothetical protein PBAL39_09246 [Pedobacter sp. BAL39]
MKLNTGHLTYCTNIHSGKNWAEDFEILKHDFPAIKSMVAPRQALGLGLRLSHEASLSLSSPEEMATFKAWLQQQDAYIFTMNGFPYGAFHHAVVKAEVHAPDWTTEARLSYTLRLFDLLAQLLPAGMDGGISTSPLTYRYWFSEQETFAEARKTATANLIKVIKRLAELERETGKLMHLDMEPEPDGMLETGREFIDWFEQDLLPAGIPVLAEALQIDHAAAAVLVRRHLCLCYDVCHFAMGYEDHEAVLQELNEKGIQIGKIQISAALKAEFRGDRDKIKAAFSAFNEPTYLHQVVARKEDGELLRYRDLPEALQDFSHDGVSEWRSHFHVPISVKEIGPLQSTQDDIVAVLKLQESSPFTNHLEVETYTWEVLPEQLKLPITESISNELNWVKNNLSS